MADTPFIIERRIGNMKEAAEALREQAGDKANTILIGPPLIYGDDELSSMVVTGPPGSLDCIQYGRFASDPQDDPFYHAFSTVTVLRRAGDVTISEAGKMRDEMIAEARRLFEKVVTFDCDKELAQAWNTMFPSDKSRKIAAEVSA